jgi:hypothetical protein
MATGDGRNHKCETVMSQGGKDIGKTTTSA